MVIWPSDYSRTIKETLLVGFCKMMTSTVNTSCLPSPTFIQSNVIEIIAKYSTCSRLICMLAAPALKATIFEEIFSFLSFNLESRNELDATCSPCFGEAAVLQPVRQGRECMCVLFTCISLYLSSDPYNYNLKITGSTLLQNIKDVFKLWNICLMTKRCHILLCCICDAVLIYLCKTPYWSNKELNSHQQGRRNDRRGWQAERINRKRNQVRGN